MSFMEHQIQKIKEFYKERLKTLFPLTIVIFVLVIVISSIVVSLNPALATRLLIQTSGTIDTAINPIGLLPTISENAFTGLMLMLSGCVPFVFISILFVMFNGSMIGILFGSTTISTVTPGLIYASILPHGIFLIPAMLIASTCGAYICKRITFHLIHKEPITSFKEILVDVGRVYLFVVLPLMVLSAIVQMFVTPYIILLL